MSVKEVTQTRQRPGMALAGLATGAALLLAGTGAQAAPAELSLEFDCPLPIIGNQIITANISAEIPAEQTVGNTDPFDIVSINVLPADVRTGLQFGRATTIEGTAIANSTVDFVSRSEALAVELDIPQTEVPEGEGPFELPAYGVAPSLTLTESDIGEAVIRVGDLFLDIITREEDGNKAFGDVGEFTSDCLQLPGQDNVLHTFNVISGDPVIPDPEIRINPEAVDFGTVQAGLTAVETLTVSNVGGASLGIQNISLSGADASAFMLTDDCNTLESNTSCTVELTYFPSGEGAQNAILSVESGDPATPVVDIPVTGSSVMVVLPEIQADTTELDFGVVPVGTLQDRAVTLSNSGGQDLVIEDIRITGAHSDDFTQTSDCTTLNDTQSCTITVTYASSVNEDRSATLEITSNDPDTAVLAIPMSASEEVITPPPGGTIVEVTQSIVGETLIAASGGTLPLNGAIDAALLLSTGEFTGELTLEPTQGTFTLSDFFLFRPLKATAQVEFESLQPTEGIIDGDDLHAISVVSVRVKSVDLSFFGLTLFPVGGGEECRTSKPVVIELSTPAGEVFRPLEGGNLEGVYDLPPLENCGSLTETLNGFMSGPGNTINLTLTAEF